MDVCIYPCVYLIYLCCGDPLPFSSESIMSLMNTMCLSSLCSCTWEMFIRSRLLHRMEVCHFLKNDQNRVSQLYCLCMQVNSCCGLVYTITDANYTHTAWCFQFGEVDYCFLLRADALTGNGFGSASRQPDKVVWITSGLAPWVIPTLK